MDTTSAALAALPQRRAREHPTGDCLQDSRRQVDNATFARDVDRLARRLRRCGVAAGDVVAVMIPNCCEIVTTMFAAWRIGATLTPVNPALTDVEVAFQLEDSAARALVGEERARAAALALDIDHVDARLVHDPAPGDEDKDEEATDLDGAGPTGADFAFVIYTSGTTGHPKGCLLDHRNVGAMVGSISTHLGLAGNDRSLLVLPLFHCNGLIVGVLSVLAAGGAVTIAPRFDPDTFWDVVEESRPTFFSAVPTIYALLESRTTRAVDTSSLRFVVCGAAPMPVDLIERFERRFDVPVVEGYGLSEGSVASTVNPVDPADGPRKPGTVGPALPGQEVRIVALDGRPLQPGQPGEVVIRGANVMRGYLGRPEDTARVVRDGWLHTGDVGYLDDDGYLVLVDRLKDMIIRGGENIYPQEVEAVLYRHPGVLEAAVVGHPDAVLGEVPVAYVAPRPGVSLDPEELRAFAAASLARYKVPREIHVRKGLPKNAVGKLVKAPLRTPGGGD